MSSGKRVRRASRASALPNSADGGKTGEVVTSGGSELPGIQAANSRQLPFAAYLWLICIVAAFARLMNVIQTMTIPTAYSLAGDALGYFQWAQQIAAGNWIGDTSFYQAPLYPYFLAVLIKLFDFEVLGLRVTQAILGAAGVGLLGIAGKRWFGPPVGLVAAAMLALFPPAIYYDGIIQKAALDTLLLCAMLALMATYRERLTIGHAFGIGVSLGLLTLTRENAMLWTPIPLLWIFLATAAMPLSSRLLRPAAYGLGLFVIFFPVAARNAYVGGEWSPTTFQAGPNFYIGNRIGANGIYQPLVPGHETPMYERSDAERLAQQATGRKLSPREVSQFWMSRSFAEIREDIGGWVELLVVKTLLVINAYEIPDVESLGVYRTYSLPLKLLGPLWHFGTLFPLAVIGMVIAVRLQRDSWVLHALIVTMIAAVALFFMLGRYRFPLVPMLVLLAAVAVVEAYRLWKAAKLAELKWPLVIGVFAAVVSNFPFVDSRTLEASSIMNQGAAAGQAGKTGESLAWIERAIEIDPTMPEAYFNLGRALANSGRHIEAIRAFEQTLKLAPDFVMVNYQLGKSLEQLGQLEAAIFQYRKASEREPHDPRPRESLERLRAN